MCNFEASAASADGLAPLGARASADIVRTKFEFCKYMQADSRFAPSQWEKMLQSNVVSHWLRASLESALIWDWHL